MYLRVVYAEMDHLEDEIPLYFAFACQKYIIENFHSEIIEETEYFECSIFFNAFQVFATLDPL